MEFDPDMVDEERIANSDAMEFVKRRENFIGSHVFGEDLDELGLMYVAYSYNKDFPLYVWYKNKWYHNTDPYKLEDGSNNEFTEKHKEELRPSLDTIGLSTHFLKKMINDFMKDNNIDGITHKSVIPGEKN